MKKITDYTTHYTDHTGEKWGRWTVEYTYYKRNSEHIYLHAHCICECGTTGEVIYKNLRRGESKSCGCWAEEFQHIPKKHGHCCGSSHGTKTYRSWHGMMSRCYCKTTTKYADYGGRGISVCTEWHDFKNFLRDMGECPENLSLDRIDVDGNYNPENCRWATWKEQCRNKRQTVYVEWEGKKCTYADLAERYGFSNGKMLYNRVVSRGWSLEKALTTPSMPLGQRSKRCKTA